MKKFATTIAAAAIATTGFAGAAFAEYVYSNDYVVTSIDRDMGMIGINGGGMLRAERDNFIIPEALTVGDEVRLERGDDHGLDRVIFLEDDA
jgi:hypothetical protein